MLCVKMGKKKTDSKLFTLSFGVRKREKGDVKYFTLTKIMLLKMHHNTRNHTVLYKKSQFSHETATPEGAGPSVNSSWPAG